MRLILGIIIGCAITVGAAYVTDSMSSSAPEAKEQMVNWDVVGTKWNRLTERARAEWVRLAGD